MKHTNKNGEYNKELVISSDHIQLLQRYAECVAELNKVLGYNITHNNSYREKAAVSLDQSMFPELGIVHNPKITGADAFDKFGRPREYKKVELGAGYKNPCARSYKKNGDIKKSKGRDGFQPSKINFMLSRFRNDTTQHSFLNNHSLTISLFFTDNALPSISYIVHSEQNLKKIVAYFNEQLHNTPHGTNKWSYNNVRIPISWILDNLDSESIDIIVMVNNGHKLITVEEHNEMFIGADLTPSGFIVAK